MDRQQRGAAAFDREVSRRQRLSGVPGEMIAAALTDEITKRPYRVDYESIANDGRLYDTTELTAPNGATQVRMRLNVTHLFVQMMLDATAAQRSAFEVMLFTRCLVRLDLSNTMPDQCRWAEPEIGRRLATGLRILAGMYNDE